MHGNNNSTAPVGAIQSAPSYLRQQREAPWAPSTSSSTWAPAPAPAPSSAATFLEASTPGGAVDTEDPDPYPLWSRPKVAAVDEPSRASSSSSRTSANQTQAPPLEALLASKTAHCKHPGCLTPAKYGLRDAPPIACQAHKRAGQYTVNRHGELLTATRDGDAFRTPAVAASVAAVGSSPASIQTTGRVAASDQSRRRSTAGGGRGGGGGRSPLSSRRKQSAILSPTSAHTFKRANRPGLSSGGEGGPAVQDRPCLFPGCDARPTYGLPGAARAVYCFSHKKGSMEPVWKNAPGLQHHGEEKTAAAATAAEGKKEKKKKKNACAPNTTTHKKEKKKARRGPRVKEEDDATADGRRGKQGVKKSGDKDEKKATGGAAPERGVNAAPAGGYHTKADSSSSSAAAATPTAKVSGKKEIAEAAAAATMPPPPPSSTNRLADASGMSPSDEILVLRQARAAAKKEAEVSGGGRRPRAPSRRALEASGRMKGAGAQWMTREKQAEQDRVKTELREQRKQYRAAGLKIGVVVEAFVGTAAAAAAVATGSAVVTGSGDVGGGGNEGVEPVLGGVGWKKVSPALL